jgi:hypothetical protein
MLTRETMRKCADLARSYGDDWHDRRSDVGMYAGLPGFPYCIGRVSILPTTRTNHGGVVPMPSTEPEGTELYIEAELDVQKDREGFALFIKQMAAFRCIYQPGGDVVPIADCGQCLTCKARKALAGVQ